jgi:hypothetical protein
MKRLAVLAAIVLLIGAWAIWRAERRPTPRDVNLSSANQPPVPARPPSGFDSGRAWADLSALVAIGPRPAGSPGIARARTYIAQELQAAGLVVGSQPFTASTPHGPVAMTNLVIRLPGRRTDRILLTGHYDTKLLRNQIFVGANDGASSAALLIELARALAHRPHEFTYDLLWFDGEEAVVDWMGLDHTYGSRHYVQAERAAHTLGSMRAMILADMIGARNLEIRRDDASTPWLTDLIWNAAKQLHDEHVFIDADTQIEDDHQPFLAAGVPSVDIIDLNYPPWHTPDDNLAHVSAASLQIVGDVIIAALPEIEQHLVAAETQ